MNITMTLFLQSITFFVFVWFCWKFIWPPVIGAMRERQRTIAEGLASAERAGKDLELARQRATEQLREAKEEARVIIEQARNRAVQMIEEAKGDARAYQLITDLQTIEAQGNLATPDPNASGQAGDHIYVPLLVGLSQEGDGTPYDQILSGLIPIAI